MPYFKWNKLVEPLELNADTIPTILASMGECPKCRSGMYWQLYWVTTSTSATKLYVRCKGPLDTPHTLCKKAVPSSLNPIGAVT